MIWFVIIGFLILYVYITWSIISHDKTYRNSRPYRNSLRMYHDETKMQRGSFRPDVSMPKSDPEVKKFGIPRENRLSKESYEGDSNPS